MVYRGSPVAITSLTTISRNVPATVVLLRIRNQADIVGYYTIGSFGIALTELPDAMRKRLPQYPVVPAVLIGRLTLDHRYE